MHKSHILTALTLLSMGAHAADMHVRGSFNNWQSQPLHRAYCTPGGSSECGLYSPTVVPGSAEHFFKFDRYGNWSENYGDNVTADAYLDRNGANISLTPHYWSKLAFEYHPNRGRPYFKVHRDDCGGMGVWGDLYNRSQRLFGGTYGRYEQYYCYQTISFEGPGQFYFTDGAATLGDTAGDLNLMVGGSGAIRVPQAGIYKITYSGNFGKPTYTISQYGSMNLRSGSYNWSNTVMQMVKPFIWSANVAFNANVPVELKFDAYGDWSTSFGDANRDLIADANGSNISLVIPTSGYYPVRFNEITRKYALCMPQHASFDPQLCN